MRKPETPSTTTGLGDIMGMRPDRIAQFGRFRPLERVLLTANGNLQRIVSSFYDADVSVAVIHCTERSLQRGERDVVAAFDREAHLSVHGSVFCVAKSDVWLHTPESVAMVSSGEIGIGQLYRQGNILPRFTLLDAGKSDDDGSFWRKYELASDVVSCVIHEQFTADIFSKETVRVDSKEEESTATKKEESTATKAEFDAKLVAAVEAMVKGSAMHCAVPPLTPTRGRRRTPTRGWLRCIEAMVAVEANLAATTNARGAHAAAAVDANDQLLVSACTVDKLGGSRAKQRVDALLAKHATRTFPDLPATLAADRSLILLLLDAPNMLTTNALCDAFPPLRTPALATRICIPQADPAHYSAMVTSSSSGSASMLSNVRFQRLATWLDTNAFSGLRVPIFFADYETSIYGRRSMHLSPLQDLQRYFRYGYAGGLTTPCLLGVTLSYRSMHKDHISSDAPVLTHEDLVEFVDYEADCAGMESELLECYRYGMVFSLFLLKRRDDDDECEGGRDDATPPNPPPHSMPEETILELLRQREEARVAHAFGEADRCRDELRAAGVTVDDRTRAWKCADGRDGQQAPRDGAPAAAAAVTTPALTPSKPARAQHLRNLRPRQSRLIHGFEHVTRRWRELGFVVGSGGLRQALLLTRELLADAVDSTRISILSVNRMEEEGVQNQELRDLQKLYPEKVRAAFSLTAAAPDSAWAGFVGRGDVAMGRAALPSPHSAAGSDEDGGEANTGVMIIVCGKVQGEKTCDSFVELWGGAMGEKLKTKGKSQMQRVQGVLGGILKDIGFTAEQVFKI